MQTNKVFLILSLCFAPFIECAEALFDAVDNNNYKKVVEILESEDPSVDINIKDNDISMALILACMKQNFKIAKLLIDKSKTDLNMRNNLGNTALIIACSAGHTQIAQLLIENPKTELNIERPLGGTALMVACENGYTQIAQLLIENPKTELNMRNNLGNTALMMACSRRHNQIAALLVLAGANEEQVTDPIERDVLNQPMVTFARNLRQAIQTNNQESHVMQALKNVATHHNINVSTMKKFNKIVGAKQNFSNPILTILNERSDLINDFLYGDLKFQRTNFAIKHFDEIYEEYKKITRQAILSKKAIPYQ